MSVIASFYTLPAHRAPELATVAAPSVTRKLFGLFKPNPTHPFQDYLAAHARQQILASDGQLIWDLEHYMEDEGLPKVRNWGEPNLTAACAPANTQWPVVVFDHPHATTAIARLQTVRPPTAEDIIRWGFYGRAAEETDFALWASRMDGARQELSACLKSLAPQDLGILDAAR